MDDKDDDGQNNRTKDSSNEDEGNENNGDEGDVEQVNHYKDDDDHYEPGRLTD